VMAMEDQNGLGTSVETFPRKQINERNP